MTQSNYPLILRFVAAVAFYVLFALPFSLNADHNQQHNDCIDDPDCCEDGEPGCCGGTPLEEGECCDDGTISSNCCAGEPLKDGEACCNDIGPYDPETRAGSFSVGTQASDVLKGKISNPLSRIPGVGNVNISSAGASFNKTVADCCPEEGGPITDGAKGADGSVSIQASITDQCIWPAGGLSTKNVEGDIGPFEFDIDFNIGVFLTMNVGPTATLGYLDNQCIDEFCYHGSVNMSVATELAFKIEAIYCRKVWPFAEECDTINITPAQASVSASLAGTWRSASCHAPGWNGSGSIGSFSIMTTIEVGAGSLNKTWYTYQGYSSQD